MPFPIEQTKIINCVVKQHLKSGSYLYVYIYSNLEVRQHNHFTARVPPPAFSTPLIPIPFPMRIHRPSTEQSQRNNSHNMAPKGQH